MQTFIATHREFDKKRLNEEQLIHFLTRTISDSCENPSKEKIICWRRLAPTRLSDFEVSAFTVALFVSHMATVGHDFVGEKYAHKHFFATSHLKNKKKERTLT